METHGATYLISGCEIDFDSGKMPLRSSLRSSFLESFVKLVLPSITYAFLFIILRSLGQYEINQNTIILGEQIYELATLLFGIMLMYITVVYIFYFAITRLEKSRMIPLSTITQYVLAAIPIIFLIPLFSIENVIILYLLLIASPSIKYTKRLIGLSKLRKNRWKPEYLDQYESQKLYDWDIMVTPDSIFSKVKQSQEGKEM